MPCEVMHTSQSQGGMLTNASGPSASPYFVVWGHTSATAGFKAPWKCWVELVQQHPHRLSSTGKGI